jgi:hypothetical protein
MGFVNGSFSIFGSFSLAGLKNVVRAAATAAAHVASLLRLRLPSVKH